MKQLLDPLGTMCKLVGLNFTRIRTKIKIQNHVLTLDKPDDLQFIFRWYNGDGKDNMWELYEVIVRLIKWYIVPQTNTNTSSSSSSSYAYTSNTNTNSENTPNCQKITHCPEFKKMVGYMCDALSKLQETYQFGNVVLTLQYYINLLQDALNGNFDESKLPQCVTKNEEIYDNLLDYDKIMNMWDVRKMKRVCELYDSCFSVIKDDLDQGTKEAMTDGYLRSISAILDITDKEFQKLIAKSNQG